MRQAGVSDDVVEQLPSKLVERVRERSENRALVSVWDYPVIYLAGVRIGVCWGGFRAMGFEGNVLRRFDGVFVKLSLRSIFLFF